MASKFSDEWVAEQLQKGKTKLSELDNQKPEPKPNKWMISNSSGSKSASLTLLVIVTVLVMLRFLLGGLVLEVGTVKLGLKEVSAVGCAGLLAPFVSLYFGRRWSETKDT